MVQILKFYQRYISPLFPMACRFYPSCSEYARECFDRFPFHQAFFKTFKRLIRCHPYCDGGIDPVF